MHKNNDQIELQPTPYNAKTKLEEAHLNADALDFEQLEDVLSADEL